MKVTYRGKQYTVGNTYTISVFNYPIRQKIKAKLVFSEYEDGEGYYNVCHLGLRFRYTRVWKGTPMGHEYITMPDTIGCGGSHYEV